MQEVRDTGDIAVATARKPGIPSVLEFALLSTIAYIQSEISCVPRERDEADGQVDFVRLNFNLGDCESRLGVHATSDTEQDYVAVDFRGGRVQFDGVHQCTAYEGETAAYKVPRHVVSVFGHESAVEDNGKNEEADKREETHACPNSRVVPRILEEERDKIDGYESVKSLGIGSGNSAQSDKAWREITTIACII